MFRFTSSANGKVIGSEIPSGFRVNLVEFSENWQMKMLINEINTNWSLFLSGIMKPLKEKREPTRWCY